MIETQIQADFEEWQNAAKHLDSWIFYPKEANKKLNQ
jgi:hypothetical protein